MKELKIPTDSLMQKLLKTSSIDRFIRRYNEKTTGVTEFHEYITSLLQEKNTDHLTIIKNADIERNYGLQLFKGIRKPSRDKVLQLALAFGLDLEETQKLLTIARKSALYPKIERDAVVIFALRKKYCVLDIQSTLHELGIPLLGEER
ncbi:MAG: hypothetical protein FWH20_08710 [Oscillospiraceae bacterium]|nr:hypothetical protein [Oscillospiraceae bacterium]